MIRQVSKVLVVDDHPIVRIGLVTLLEAEPDLQVVGQAEDVRGALQAVAEDPPEIIIADVSLKDSDGLELVGEMRRRHPDIPVLILSMYDELLYAERFLKMGARGYVMKSKVDEHLLAAVRDVLKGNIHVSEAVQARLLQSASRSPGPDEPVDRLSNREFQVFQFIGEGKSTRQIAEQLHISIKTVESHRQHIREKLNLENGTELVRYAIHWRQRQL